MTRRSKSSRTRAKRAKRRALVTLGQGAYLDAYKSKNGEITKIGKALRALGGLGGKFAAPYAGIPPAVGSTAGTNLAGLLSKWLGFGAYKVRVNSILNPESFIPMMHREGQSVVVRHKEFLGDVISGSSGTPSTFNIFRTYSLNPGLSSTFPWLSTIARQYQEYTWRGVVFHFVSTSGASVASTNTALGSVMMHSDYRVTAPVPTSKVELLNEYFATDAKPSDCFVHPIECDPKENPYNVQYVRTGAVPSGEDAKTYDLCKVNVATQGMPAASTNVGELWVTYEVELRKPQISGMFADSDHIISSGTISTANVAGTAPSVTSGSTIGCTMSGSTVFFPAGTVGAFMIYYHWTGTTVTTTYSSTTYTNSSGINICRGTAGFVDNTASGQTTGAVILTVNITDPAKNASVGLEMSALTNCTTCDVFVMRISPTLG